MSQLQWVVNGYALTFAGLMLSFGTMGDLFGRKKIMLGGVAVFAAGSVVAALAPTTDVLIAGRVIMGVGAAASEPGTLSMIRQLYRSEGDGLVPLGSGPPFEPRPGPRPAPRWALWCTDGHGGQSSGSTCSSAHLHFRMPDVVPPKAQTR